VIVSLNEIETAVRKAALGVGLPLGIAEEAGLAAAWAAPLPLGIEALIAEALTNIDEKRVLRQPADKAATSALWLGPSAADFAFAMPDEPIILGPVDVPILVAAIVARAGEGKTERSAAVAWGGSCSLALNHGEIGIWAPSLAALTARGLEFTVTRGIAPGGKPLFAANDLRRLKLQALSDGVPVGSAAWTDIKRYAAKTLVPATAQSRLRGAGAGDIDSA
jgi:hypothetical protein